MLLPVVIFLVIGRTVEIRKALDEMPEQGGEALLHAVSSAVGDHQITPRRFGLSEGSSAGAGLSRSHYPHRFLMLIFTAVLTIFLSPHINTLPIHSTLPRIKRSSFPVPCLVASAVILVLSLPFALVPYYLLPDLVDDETKTNPTSSSGVFARLPADDAWVNVARVCMLCLVLGSSNIWILRGRDTLLTALGIDRGQRQRAGRWAGLGLWVIVVAFACLGGIVAEKLELLGVMATLAIGWLLPCESDRNPTAVD